MAVSLPYEHKGNSTTKKTADIFSHQGGGVSINILSGLKAIPRILIPDSLLSISGDFILSVSVLTVLIDDMSQCGYFLSIDSSVIKVSSNPAPAGFCLSCFCMGEAGRISRLVTLYLGGYMTYACLSDAQATAPGQIAARRLQEITALLA